MFDWLRDLRKSAETRREERTIAYVDGQLSDAESQLFEQEMVSDSALREDVAQVRRVKSSLREIPRQRVPYNFTLDPAVYGKPEPAYGARAYPILQGATAFAALVFVIMAALTLLPFNSQQFSESVAYDAISTAAEPELSAPMAEPQSAESLAIQEEEADVMAADSAAESAMVDESTMDEDFSAEMSRALVITPTGTASAEFSMQSDEAVADDDMAADMLEESAEGISSADGTDAAVEDAMPEAAPAENAAAPTIALNPTATVTSPILTQAFEPEPTVVITVSQAGPDDVNVLSGEDAAVEEIQTVEPAPRRAVQPLLLWTLIVGTLFLLLLATTLIIRRQF